MITILLSNQSDIRLFDLLKAAVFESTEFYTKEIRGENSLLFSWKQADLAAGQVCARRLTDTSVLLELEDNLDPVETTGDFMFFISASLGAAEQIMKSRSPKGLILQRISPSLIHHPKVREALANGTIVKG